MKSGEQLVARSGLKPLGMLLSCLVLFAVIAGRVTSTVVKGEETKRRDPITKTRVAPRYDVLDRFRLKIATDTVLHKLSMSPNAMWQGHTPGRIAAGLKECLEPENRLGGESLLDRMLPGSKDGVIQVHLQRRGRAGEGAPEWFLDPEAAERLDDWLMAGEGERPVPVSGMWLRPAGKQGDYRICWMPEVLLSESTREVQGFRRVGSEGGASVDRPSAWCRRIAARLAPCLGMGAFDSMTARREVWKLLMPSRYQVVLSGLTNAEAWRIRSFLRAEGISEGQMKLVAYRERSYPAAVLEAAGSAGRGMDRRYAGWAFLGEWSYLGWEDSTRLVLRRHGLELRDEELTMRAMRTIGLLISSSDGVSAREALAKLDKTVGVELLEAIRTIAVPSREREGARATRDIAELGPRVSEELLEAVESLGISPSEGESLMEGALWLASLQREVAEEIRRQIPRSGLEKSCMALFELSEFEHLRAEPASYSFLAYHPARASSQRSLYGGVDEAETPRVLTTIDALLQNFLHGVLVDALEEHDGALAMGIVIEVNTGEVLAIDGVSPYELEMFLPLQYGFTPGSTFKPITATAAIDLKVVSPDQRFRTFNRSIHLGQFVKGSKRTIVEARNSELGVDGRLSLREGLAHSINAVMVQVGLKMPIEQHRSILIELGYGQGRQTELGMVAAGMVSPYKKWKRKDWTQASVSIGHEIQCTLWQHAEGLLTILRGGERLPLRVLQSVERGEEVQPVPAAEPKPVFAAASCEEVRRMMRLAARIGTGERLYEELLAKEILLVWGGKTGTTEKPDDTACAHIELACAVENVERRRNGQPLLNCTKEGKTGTRPHSRDCYTSSMMAFGSVGDPRGSLPLAGEQHEVMVLIVIEEPRGKQYYGSQVAGPATIAVLLEALHLTHDGQAVEDIISTQTSVPVEVSLGLSEDPVRDIPTRFEEGER